VGGGGTPSAGANHIIIFDRNNSTLLVHDRSTLSFEENPTLPLSSLGIALQQHIRGIMKHLSSCLHPPIPIQYRKQLVQHVTALSFGVGVGASTYTERSFSK
jgi:hypothetical protein